MNGEVAPGLAVTLRVRVRGDGDATIEVTGIVDTGFTGYLTLPSHLIKLLGLTYHADVEAQMGDGRVVTMRLFRAGVAWHNQPRSVLVHETDVPPLIGRALLKGSLLTIAMLDGGRVSIEPLP